MHLDVFGDLEDLMAHGARVIDRQPDWAVLADPDGNEFCAFPPRD